MRPTPRQAFILFAPAMILAVWAAVTALKPDVYSDPANIVVFLALLAVSVAWAERTRIDLRSEVHRMNHRRKLDDERKRDRGGEDS